jgi:hypothetical protein
MGARGAVEKDVGEEIRVKRRMIQELLLCTPISNTEGYVKEKFRKLDRIAGPHTLAQSGCLHPHPQPAKLTLVG